MTKSFKIIGRFFLLATSISLAIIVILTTGFLIVPNFFLNLLPYIFPWFIIILFLSSIFSIILFVVGFILWRFKIFKKMNWNIGFLAVFVLILLLWLSYRFLENLPAPPSSYKPKFQLVRKMPPTNLWSSIPSKITGSDIYDCYKCYEPILKRDMPLPCEHSVRWNVYKDYRDNISLIIELWSEINETAYRFVYVYTNVPINTNLVLNIKRTISIDTNRSVMINFEAPEHKIDVNFGPFRLP